jgi:hypothetical protein
MAVQDQFLARDLEELLASCCTLHPSSNPTRKSQVGLNLVITGVLNRSSASYPSVKKGVVKIGPDIMMVRWECPILFIPHVLISTEQEI